ncbi:MAG: hypothetical protein ACLR1V_01770 [Coprococcus sp.]
MHWMCLEQWIHLFSVQLLTQKTICVVRMFPVVIHLVDEIVGAGT